MNHIEAMKQALEAYLSREMPAGTVIGDPKWWASKIANVANQAIAEAEQEPVLWAAKESMSMWGKSDESGHPYHIVCKGKKVKSHQIPLYTHPQPQPKREWVGLTDEEIDECSRGCANHTEFARAIEAKLKEKNSG